MPKTTSNLFAILLFAFVFSCGWAQQNKPNTEWTEMFNGKDLRGWTTKIHHYDVNDNHGDTFRVEDGIIKVRYDRYEGDFNNRFGHLYYDVPYSYFHLSMEYRFVGELHPGAPDYTLKNSGVMFHSQDPRTILKEQDWPISVEMQFLAGIEEGTERPTGNMCSPGTDVQFEGKIDPRHCINSNSDTYFGDQWVKAELIVLGDSVITHIINGKEVLTYTKPQMGGGVVNGFDTAIFKAGTPLKEGYIALQSEGQPIDFRDVKIKNLKGCMNPNAKNYKSYFVASDPKSCIYN
ncbi:3-keto-disaccharide hydrolase [Maribacter sp. CXY002]|uniref:3-keto-disaccharide hydrolase n=1 Tax=Maribacter luteocoastalis TaxID=3407671 RepID=UPI003B676B0B